ncbi:MAG: FtsW/RodA/SpoVE family cell cycle protein [Planctomycetota bacterium]
MFRFLQGRLLTVRLIMLGAAGALICVGIAVIYASGHPAERAEPFAEYAGLWKKQLVFACVGFAGLAAVNFFSYRRLGPVSYWVYGGVLGLLAVLLLDKFVDLPFVPVINYSRRWLLIGTESRSLGQMQPSELCKLAYIVALAWYLRFRSNYRKFTALVGPFVLTVVPMLLILMEPDLGTVLLMMPVLFTMVFVAGAKVKHLLMIILMAVLVSPVMWHFMHSYQRMRITSVFLQNEGIFKMAEKYPKLAEILAGDRRNLKTWQRDHGFQLMQSKCAIGSGGVNGYGYRKGPYLRYSRDVSLPERHNDFIFAIIAQQWGFVGCVIVLGLYTVIIACGLEIATANTDPFARLISIGIVAMFAVEVLVNVSMTLGLMPITGLTLPLVSYGGSSLVVSMLGIGLLNNVGSRRPFTVAGKGFDREESY